MQILCTAHRVAGILASFSCHHCLKLNYVLEHAYTHTQVTRTSHEYRTSNYNYIGHNYIGQTHLGLSYIGHSYIGHKYVRTGRKVALQYPMVVGTTVAFTVALR